MSELNKRVNTEAAAHRCSVAVLKNQKQPSADVLWNRCSFKSCNIQRKTPVLGSVFNKVGELQLSCQYWEIFKRSFFHKTSAMAAYEKFMNFPGQHQRRRCNRFIFLITWLSEICLTLLIALFWNFLLFWNFWLMIWNFQLLFSHSKNIECQL